MITVKFLIRRVYMFLPLLFSLLFTTKMSAMQKDTAVKGEVYIVKKLSGSFAIDAKWDKDPWQNTAAVQIKNHMGDIPSFVPVVEAKMRYDENNLYVIFRVQDKFVKSTVTKINGPVSENSCVEFFFSPDTANPLHYFNLEINAGGTPLLFYITKPWSGYKELNEEEIKQIEIAHSLPRTVDPEIKENVEWTVEYRIPISLLSKYTKVSQPAPGVKWKANFYKTGSETSNPNYMTWSVVKHPKPNFHLPEFFGTIIFE